MKKIKLFFIAISTAILIGGCTKTAGNTIVDGQAPIDDELAEKDVSNSEDVGEVNEEEADTLLNPIYYHSISDADETGIYLGGAGSIHRINSESGVQTIYSAPHMAGAALYKDYIFSMEYYVSDNGMTTELIRINKDGSDKKMLTQISGGSYDLRIIDNVLVITEQIIGDYGLETLFYAYTLDDEGNLTSDMPTDVYNQYGRPGGYEDGMRFLIDPWFSTKYFGYSCFMKAVGEIDINSVWIKTEDEEPAKEIVTCSGNPLVAKDMIFYCDSNGETLTQRSLDNAQEAVLYEIPDDNNLSLLTYDAEWVYFLQKPRIDEHNELSSFMMRVNLQDHRTEEIYELQAGNSISNFNVYGNNCYFILSGAGDVEWKFYDLNVGNDIENLEDNQTVSEVVAPTREEVLAMREHVLEGMSAEEIERLTENIKIANMKMESAYLYDNIFTKLADKESLYWNYFDQKGEIQIAWAFDGDGKEMKAIMDEEGLSQKEFYEKYGTPVTIYNRFDAENFMNLIEEMKETVQNEALRNDLQQIIDETRLAAETHEMEHANNIYKLLHDMDYYLLRYGLGEVAPYTKDKSTLAKYYGVLTVYTAGPIITEADWSNYFDGINGAAVIYDPIDNCYQIYNQKLALTRLSPCSTFKIISSLIALENGIIEPNDSTRTWSGEIFPNEEWNRDIDFSDAFHASCVWYFREVIDEIGKDMIQKELNKLEYGNCDISDWNGQLNTNNKNPVLTGFWIESSLLISPKEQVEVMERIFGDNTDYSEKTLNQLKQVMLLSEQSEGDISIYGKTGMGMSYSIVVDSWYTGFADTADKRIYFCVYLGETDNNNVSSAKAREIAVKIVSEW